MVLHGLTHIERTEPIEHFTHIMVITPGDFKPIDVDLFHNFPDKETGGRSHKFRTSIPALILSRFMATLKASFSVVVVVTSPKSIPKCTKV